MSPVRRAALVRRSAVVLLVLLGAVAAGCSKSRHPAIFTPGVGHPDGWIADHGEEYRKRPAGCVECHGADLSGGVSGVSCSSAGRNGVVCHPGGVSDLIHPDGWGAMQQHGPRAKAAPGPASGLAWCQGCHGEDFGGGRVHSACVTCHGVPAPHSRAPWRGAPATHVTTDPGNAPVCARCHRRAGSGGEPGCFNGTLCHTARGVHPAGWESPANHGAAAKRAPGGSAGFAYCTRCHGTDYQGNGSGVSCFPCHRVSAPHSPSPWRARYTHTTTDQGNAPACLPCHRAANPPPGAAPGCFNGTLCHTQRGVHPGGWGSPTNHGAAAKRAPGATTGFTTCTRCHGTDYQGDGSGVSCFPCHGVSAPHPRTPWRGVYTHTTTDQRNAAACLPCHRNAYPPPGAAPGCFNNTLCHPHEPGWAGADLHGAGAKARPSPTRGFAACQSCHGRLFNGGVPGATCYRAAACHTVPTPHSPAPWRGARTHATTHGGNAVVCALCHRRPGAPASLPDNCFNTSLCHDQR